MWTVNITLLKRYLKGINKKNIIIIIIMIIIIIVTSCQFITFLYHFNASIHLKSVHPTFIRQHDNYPCFKSSMWNQLTLKIIFNPQLK